MTDKQLDEYLAFKMKELHSNLVDELATLQAKPKILKEETHSGGWVDIKYYTTEAINADLIELEKNVTDFRNGSLIYRLKKAFKGEL